MPSPTTHRHGTEETSSTAFGILVVDRDRARLFLCDDRRVRELANASFPVPRPPSSLRSVHRGDGEAELVRYVARISAALTESVEPDLPLVLAGASGPLTAFRTRPAGGAHVVASLPVGQGAMSPRGLHHQALRALGRARPARRH
jgi:hypothetical protein